MPDRAPDAPVVLAVVVGARGSSSATPDRRQREHLQEVRLVQALLVGFAGRELEVRSGTACIEFQEWGPAIDAALAFRSQLRRLPSELAGIEVRIGLDVAAGARSRGPADAALRIAASASPDEIRIGAALADAVRADPPDRMVVRPVAAGAKGGATARLVAAAAEIPNNLGRASTSFVGREPEIRTVRSLLGRGRLITLTGPPGTGKTRLASEIAERILGRYSGGAWFVPLAPLRDPALVWSAIAEALGLAVGPARPARDAVVDQLRPRRALLVLDNIEHLLAAAVGIGELVAAAPDIHVVVTSRTPLHVDGETTYDLAPFAIGPIALDGSSQAFPDAVELFAARADESRSGFRVGRENAGQVAELCRNLDGLPLAIELAAARLKTLPLSAILERLDDRLGLHAGESSGTERHDSLRAAIAWSYDLLGTDARRLFRHLSVFRGGWSVEASAAVFASEGPSGAGPGDLLAALIDANLIHRSEGEGDQPRFSMLETLREYGAARLVEDGEATLARRLHAEHYGALVAALQPQLTGPGQAAALDRLAEEHDNLRAALSQLIESDPAAALRLTSGIWRFWQMRGFIGEGGRWVDAALDAAGDDAPPEDRASALAAAGGLAYWRGDLVETERRYTDAVRIRRSLEDDVLLADALFDLAFVFDPSLSPPPEDPSRTALGIELAEEAHERYVQAGHQPGIAKSEWLLGSIVAGTDLDRAKRLLGSSVDGFRAIQDLFGLGWALHSYGLALLRGGESDAAGASFSEALSMFATAGDGSAIALLLDDFAELARAEGDALRTARLRGASSTMRASTEAGLAVANAPWLLDDVVPRGLVDPAELERAWNDGRSFGAAAAIDYALRADPVPVPAHGLRVRALGPLVVDRSGEPLTDWGGPKAGSRHALAIFAFLMDRGERGVTKDEFVEVLWPDAGVEQGDLNFHRTLGGLRGTLAPDNAAGSPVSVVFSNGRYHLDGGVVGWLDVTEFQERLRSAAEATDDLSSIRGLEAARQLYRGDYLDDCPLYGDSEYVEERRRFLRGRFVDALVDLGRRYEMRHDESLASARFREALTVSGGDCPSASDGLARLGVARS